MCFWAFVYEGVQWRGGVGLLAGEVVGVVLGLRLRVGVGVGVRGGLSKMEDRRRRRKR